MIRKKHLLRFLRIISKYLKISTIIGSFSKPPIIFTSIPKSGTNLLLSFFHKIPGYRFQLSRGLRPWLYSSKNEYLKPFRNLKRGLILHGHIEFDPELVRILESNSEYRIIMLYRDPRDILVSTYNYLEKMELDHRVSKYFQSLPNRESKLSALIHGVDGLFEPLGKVCMNYLKWSTIRNCYPISYESLIDIKQDRGDLGILSQIKSILDLGQISNKTLITYLKSEEYTQTLRKGAYGEWESFFNEKEKDLINRELNEPMKEIKRIENASEY